MDHGTSRRGVVLAALVVAVLVWGTAARPAGAHPYIPRWYQYDKVVWHDGWRSSRTLVAEHDQWHDNHPRATWQENADFHHTLGTRWRSIHFHDALSRQDGKVTWYDGTGRVGACGVRLYGLYAASRTLRCGALVSVRHDGRYLFADVWPKALEFHSVAARKPRKYCSVHCSATSACGACHWSCGVYILNG